MTGKGIPRPVEALVAGLGLVTCSPILAVCALAVRLSSRGPILYSQKRVGVAGHPFTLFKFRTMVDDSRGPAVTAGHDPRITEVGRFLRHAKLDELPQLWNVIRGDMALVGPRPEIPEFVNLYDPRWQEALSVRPGLTDPVTLHLRNEEALLAACGGDPERFYRDVLVRYKLEGYGMYLSQRTWWTDVRVLIDTIVTIVSRRGERGATLEQIRSSVKGQEADTLLESSERNKLTGV